MQQITGNLFEPSTYSLDIIPDAICITTNGFVKKNGEAVMGRGCAKQARDKYYPSCPGLIGDAIKKNGNVTQSILLVKSPEWTRHLVMFPVKPQSDICMNDRSNVVKHMQNKFKPGDKVPGWASVASFDLIYRSAVLLNNLAKEKGWTTVALPRPGCGAGELSWQKVRIMLDGILDNRFYSINFN